MVYSLFETSRRWLGTTVLLAILLVGCQDAAKPQPPAATNPSENTASSASAESQPVGNAENSSSSDATTTAGEPQSPLTSENFPASNANAATPKDDPLSDHPFPRRIKAPSLQGGLTWINAAGPIDIQDLKGKFVLLDFWTYCCINCMHILPELKKLEQAYPNELVVIGVHSAKFETEKDTQNITDAVLRYEIEHPVVNDANHAIWDRYQISGWPALRIIDPEGNLVAGHGGEIEFEALDQFMKEYLPYYRKKQVLDETPLRFDLASYAASRTPLRYPGKILADEAGGRLFIADSNHNRLVIAGLDGQLKDVIGTGAIGAADGSYDKASFNKPQGMVLRDSTLYVADTENHLLRKIDLAKQQVTTIAGIGKQGRNAWPGLDYEQVRLQGEEALPKRFVGPPKTTEINSPWDLWIQGEDLYIAMAGPHQIWKMTLDEKEIGPYAGNGREDIVDGILLPKWPHDEGFSSFAQPSGLASDGKWLYVADSEGSSIRAVPFDPKQEVRTIVGTSRLPFNRLFTFGDVDGKGANVRLQHALGVVVYDGALYVADTYNNKIKVIDLADESIKTLVGNGEAGRSDVPATFDEPAGISAAGGKLYVADTNNHLIRTIDLKDNNRVQTLEIKGLSPPQPGEVKLLTNLPGGKQVELPPASVKIAEGAMRMAVELVLPEGYKINDKAPMSYRVEALTDAGPIQRGAIGKAIRLKMPATNFEVLLPTAAAGGEERLRVALTYYYCQTASEGICKVGNVTWTVPVTVSPSATEPELKLRHQVE